MRIRLLYFIMLCISQSAYAQNDRNAICMLQPSVIRIQPLTTPAYPKPVPPYDLKTINHNLKLDGRLIISGAVLTGYGGAIFLAGCIYEPIAVHQDEITRQKTGHADMLGQGTVVLALWLAGATYIVPGVPLLAVGLTQRRKWRGRSEQFNTHAGLLPDGHLGVAMNF
jgi:hypothetical protein